NDRPTPNFSGGIGFSPLGSSSSFTEITSLGATVARFGGSNKRTRRLAPARGLTEIETGKSPIYSTKPHLSRLFKREKHRKQPGRSIRSQGSGVSQLLFSVLSFLPSSLLLDLRPLRRRHRRRGPENFRRH